MTTQLIWYPKCSTCQKAKKQLEAAGESISLRHIVEEPLTETELTELIRLSNLPIKKWFNTSGNKYKELGLKDKLQHMSDQEMIQLLAGDGMLVKRPVIRRGDQVTVGFKA